MAGGYTIWITGLSGAGKSTLARRLEAILMARGQQVEVLDGDEVRENLSKGLGFSKDDRDTNIRRIAYVARLLTRNGVTVIAAAISPYREVRDEVRAEIGAFVEVFARCPLDVLVQRDRKGLYARALRGEIPQFTGVSDPYEEPLAPEVTVDTDTETPDESLATILTYLEAAGYLVGADGRVAPHGGRLIHRIVPEQEAPALRNHLRTLPRVTLGRRALLDLEMIGIGAFSPLEGFLGPADYESVVEHMRLANGLPWSIPITLPIEQREADGLSDGQEVALVDARGQTVAMLSVTACYRRDVGREAQQVYGTADLAHPGVRAVHDEGTILLAGPVTLVERTRLAGFAAYDLAPAEMRRLFTARAWRTIVGFQTRNPIHRAHEYITKVALEGVDALLLHPLVGATKEDDIPADVRMRCYEALVAGYYPPDRTQLSVLPAAMRYAGPREAILHALVRKNYGCTHFIVGRDHAGVGSYYGTYDAQRIFSAFAPGELGITPLFFENAFYSQRLMGMATDKTAPAAETDERVSLSGTRVRAMLRAGALPPPEFTRPEVAHILVEALHHEDHAEIAASPSARADRQ